ncbi:MFS transporter [Pandoraea pulmonicola]|nr:MFS transporter [Pandoraea pulmonicola]SUA92797.1 oxalate/formate antiporter family transporter [Pandoraea pulmonicola]
MEALDDVVAPGVVRVPEKLDWPAVRVLLGAGVGMFLTIGPVLVFTFGIFLEPVARLNTWSAVRLASAVGPALLIVALIQPATGTILDKYGPKRFALVAIPVFALGLIGVGALPHTESGFIGCLVLAICLGAGQTPVVYSYLVSEWFDRHRGLALGFVLSFSGLGVAAWPGIAGYLITVAGWRMAYVILGVIVLTVGTFAAVCLIRDPADARRSSHGTTAVRDGLALKDAVRHRGFWILATSFFIMAAVTTGAVVHMPAMLMGKGLSLQSAASMSGLVGVASIIACWLIGAVLDRVFPPLVTCLVLLCPALGCWVLHAFGFTGAPVAALLIGVGLGAEGDALGYVASRIFGLKHFGAVYGALMVVFLLGAAAGPAMFAFCLAGYGGYASALPLSAATGTCAALMVLLIRRSDFQYQ